MRKVLIADDEKFECLMLTHMFSRLYPGQFTIRTVENGRQAISASLEDPPHILFMDIEMPGINGIDAARQIIDMLPQTIVIFLSAHKIFTYAQDAVSIGAIEYLLKPITDEVFQKAVEKALHILHHEGKKAEYASLFGEQFLSLLLSGHAAEREPNDYVGIRNTSPAVGTIAIVKGMSQTDTPFFEYSIKSVLMREGIQVATLEYDSLQVVMLTSADPSAFLSILERDLPAITQIIVTKHSPNVRIAVGVSFTDTVNAYDSFASAYALQRQGFDNALVYFCQPQSFNPEEQIYNELEKNGVPQALEVFKSHLDSYDAYSLLHRTLRYLDERAIQNFGCRFTLDIPNELNRWNRTSILVWTERCFLEYRNRSDKTSQQNTNPVIESIKQYVHEHYTTELFLSDIATAMNYSEAYFSRLFSQHFGESFTAYLTGVRIDMAKSLLVATTSSVRKIGAAVGYNNSNYFTKVFRRATGLSPSEYRSSLLNKEVETK